MTVSLKCAQQLLCDQKPLTKLYRSLIVELEPKQQLLKYEQT